MKKSVFIKTVFLGKSSHSESIGPLFEKCKLFNNSHYPNFFQVLFLGRNIFFMTMFLGKLSNSKSIKPPLENEKYWKFSSLTIFSLLFLKMMFFLAVLLKANQVFMGWLDPLWPPFLILTNSFVERKLHYHNKLACR